MAPGVGQGRERKQPEAVGASVPQPVHRGLALHTAAWCRIDGVSVFHMWLISWGQSAVLAIRQINCVFMALPGESKISHKQFQTE